MLDGKKLIEIRKAGFVNKGAELMLYAILDKMREAYPNANFAMAPHPVSATYLNRASLTLYQKPHIYISGIQIGVLANFVPKLFRDMYGVVLDSEIDVVLDAAGFSYSDEWSEKNSLELADSCKRWKKNGTKVILLPQAFGPFLSPRTKKAMNIVMDSVDLVYAREQTSYNHLVEVVGERTNLKIAPDFTNLIDPILPDDINKYSDKYCLVPNYRMIDKTVKKQSDAYIPFMISCAKYLLKKGKIPFILVHEGADDLMIAKNINDAIRGGVLIVKETNPLKIKGILGTCKGTVGSRFHGLVSALSQGVPSLATGWSHKYEMLFNDYGFPEGVIEVIDGQYSLEKMLDILIDESLNKKISKQLKIKSQLLKKKSILMWGEVFNVLNNQSNNSFI
jgi:polysaccharide pyruvyl transferase WcaK-like protein